ncbi:Peptidoglycan/LPS O-acetylase OafA/YrhL, contains acyltransferase and SGNH-hydrolase domains [Geodermatophilus saharensis]|uniref:Peptidoglycan/LPS O-acetylase OafA/YrhL, contains acyltransferase and SGNH-hydrolase domains n=1 Tax=Geodermatophilus saharensis TaxID=1137994 RepID=A0A238ZX18_9ACTN|nr:acyltransferase [Geodermatophilus saharensis]SNR87915.1 Peptidoglycan/LPS O-acetylase OafA/YrhL, contains acyltransferase and SGNH-hydrolase domains [Geodermatophilus saharensis]
MHSTQRPTRRAEIRALTGLRLVAALWVVAYHLGTGLQSSVGPAVEPLMPVVRAGWLGVDLFFVLSGFVMALTYLDTMGPRFGWRRSGVFLWARLARVWPLWVLLTLLFSGWLLISDRGLAGPPGHQRVVEPLALLEQLFMVQMWHRDEVWGSTFVLAGWSLSVEMLAYVCFPLLVLVLWRLRRLPVTLLAAGSVAAMVPLAYLAYRTGAEPEALPWTLRIAGAFVSGGLVCLAVRRLEGSSAALRWSPLVAALAVAHVVFVCLWAATRAQHQPGHYAGVATMLFPVLVGALALAPRGLATLLSGDTAVLGGRISFALYLVHGCVFEIADDVAHWVRPLNPGTPLWALVQPGLVLASLLLAWVLFRFVEEPARGWMRRIGPSSGARRGDRPVAAAGTGGGTVALPLQRPVARPVAAPPHPHRRPATAPRAAAVRAAAVAARDLRPPLADRRSAVGG